MARIEGVPAGKAGPFMRLVYWMARRHMRQLAGRETERMLEPSFVAHAVGIAKLEEAGADDRAHATAGPQVDLADRAGLGIGNVERSWAECAPCAVSELRLRTCQPPAWNS